MPHLIEYPPAAKSPSEQIPFQTYFKVEPLSEYTKVILMDDFMTNIAPTVWPKGKRSGNLFKTFIHQSFFKIFNIFIYFKYFAMDQEEIKRAMPNKEIHLVHIGINSILILIMMSFMDHLVMMLDLKNT